MARCIVLLIVLLSFFACAAATKHAGAPTETPAVASQAGANLIGFDRSKPDGGWERWSPRPELAPMCAFASGEGGAPSLTVSGGGKQHVFGGWRREVGGLEEGQGYRFSGYVAATGVDNLRLNVTCRIRWTGRDLSNDVSCAYVTDFGKSESGIVPFAQVFTAPKATTGAFVELLIDQAPAAEVTFAGVALEKADAPKPRPVTVATVYWRPKERSTAAKNVVAFSALMDKAAASHPDVILLPEAINSIGTGTTTPQSAEPLDGPTFKALAAKAAECACYVIYGAYEKTGDILYNSAVIIDRKGLLAGVYHKVQLPESEEDGALTPGDSYRTFDLDFGRIGILICYDTAFPEPARVEALDGAEVIFVPIWGGDVAQLKTRAMDNAVWVVTSGYDVASMVIDPNGEVLASTWKDQGDGVVVQKIDLSQEFRRPYTGEWRNLVAKQRRTDAYGPVTEK